MGIPSVKRVNGPSYILKTVKSLVQNTTPTQRTVIVIVVFLADFDVVYNNQVTEQLLAHHRELVKSGFIQIVTVEPSFYPPLKGLKRNFNDRTERVAWRSKQVSDYVFLLIYSQGLSDYYMQLEDDVISAPNFSISIRNYIKFQREQWTILEFSELGFIGKLFKNVDLMRLARFLWTFYDEQPVDWLVRYFRMAMAQKTVRLRKPTLFQHMGVVSSFDTSKPNKLKDKFFVPHAESKTGIEGNPEAKIFTSLKTHDQFLPEYAYFSIESYFWSHTVRTDDYYMVVFNTSQYVKAISIETGLVSTQDKKLTDYLRKGIVEVSYDGNNHLDNSDCHIFMPIGEFVAGQFKLVDIPKMTLVNKPMKCIRIVVTESQKDWLVIYQISVQNSIQLVTSRNI